MIQTDLFNTKPKTQKMLIYDFIKTRGRVLTHELNQYALANNINQPGSRSRELKAEGKIWRINNHQMICLWPKSKEEAWSCLEVDR